MKLFYVEEKLKHDRGANLLQLKVTGRTILQSLNHTCQILITRFQQRPAVNWNLPLDHAYPDEFGNTMIRIKTWNEIWETNKHSSGALELGFLIKKLALAPNAESCWKKFIERGEIMKFTIMLSNLCTLLQLHTDVLSITLPFELFVIIMSTLETANLLTQLWNQLFKDNLKVISKIHSFK